jgi:hypothetical protein
MMFLVASPFISRCYMGRKYIIITVLGFIVAGLVTALALHLITSRHRLSPKEEVVQLILQGNLTPNSAGQVALPPKYKVMSADGQAYVTRCPDGNVLVLFPNWRGKGSNFYGSVYTRNIMVPAAKEFVLFVPCPGPAAGAVNVPVVGQVDDHWYDLRSDLD